MYIDAQAIYSLAHMLPTKALNFISKFIKLYTEGCLYLIKIFLSMKNQLFAGKAIFNALFSSEMVSRSIQKIFFKTAFIF